jgi:hypothetical protein
MECTFLSFSKQEKGFHRKIASGSSPVRGAKQHLTCNQWVTKFFLASNLLFSANSRTGMVYQLSIF